ncbi:MAG TPA: 5-deoxy-glucuronate isomerase, partial [Agrobacterium sp.]|nr:5-deoxy-glucuronate isomerase [Agrobacterium sp.]
MTSLLRKPVATSGKVHDITPQSADWGYVGFGLYRLKPGETAAEKTGDTEVILVLVEGKATISAGGKEFGELGDRMNVFERKPPHCVYVPAGSEWSLTATTDCTVGVCTAPGEKGSREAQQIGPTGVQLTERGKGANTRYIFPIAMEERDV